MSIASRLLDNTTLHRLIREQGGAYGGGSSNRLNLGYFSFYAYRDPNLASTLKAFSTALHYIADGNFSNQELEEAKLGIIQKFDHPISPEYRALTAYTWFNEKKDLQVRKNLRNKILSATKEDIKEALKILLIPKVEESTIITFASKNLIEKENQKLAKDKKETFNISEV